MSEFGKTIRIYLASGSPTGIRHAELVNWTGQAIVCPRPRIGELSDWEESKRPGVYILLGFDDDDTPLAYLGEAENVHLRLQGHLKGKDFWDEAVFITSKDENLTKAHAKYLESRMIGLARRAGRVALENGTSPPLPSLPRADLDAMEEFLIPARTLLGALGFSVLQPLQSRDDPPTQGGRLTLTDIQLFWVHPKRSVDAQGASTDEGFVVFEGSRGTSTVTPSWDGGYRRLRKKLLANGTLVQIDNAVRFTRDALFNSPSAAAAVLYGQRANGRTAWKSEDGTTLKELEERLAAAADDSPMGDRRSCRR